MHLSQFLILTSNHFRLYDSTSRSPSTADPVNRYRIFVCASPPSAASTWIPSSVMIRPGSIHEAGTRSRNPERFLRRISGSPLHEILIQKERARLISQPGSYLCRQRPTLPHTFACSTIGPAGLNLRRLEGVSVAPFATREPSAEILSRVLCGEGSLHSQGAKGKSQIDFSTWLLLMPATTYSPTHFRVQYNRPSGA